MPLRAPRLLTSASRGRGGHWSVVDAIPAGTLCVVALIEYSWGIPLREPIQMTGSWALAARVDPFGRPALGEVGAPESVERRLWTAVE